MAMQTKQLWEGHWLQPPSVFSSSKLKQCIYKIFCVILIIIHLYNHKTHVLHIHKELDDQERTNVLFSTFFISLKPL